MKALTLTQPWASLVALGEKQVETRSWETGYRGPIAIHAAKGLAGPVCNEDGLRRWVDAEPFAEALGRHGVTVAEQLPRAAVVATARLVACLPVDELGTRMRMLPAGTLAGWRAGEHERAFGDYSPGRFAWILADIMHVAAPIECRGAQGLWTVPDDVRVLLP